MSSVLFQLILWSLIYMAGGGLTFGMMSKITKYRQESLVGAMFWFITLPILTIARPMYYLGLWFEEKVNPLLNKK